MEYLHWDEKTITDFSENNIADMYARGYVFTRIGKGVMHQTRSVRIDLAKFELSSENRRILKRVGEMSLEPVKEISKDYDWSLGKLAKDFYEDKFGPGIMSAAKIKEMLTDPTKSNFDSLLAYDLKGKLCGYSICYSSRDIMHYSYPFYDMDISPKDMGLGMMIMAIQYAKETGKQFVYLGSLQRPSDTYKLQFEGLEWFDGGPPTGGGGIRKWRTDMEEVKKILATT
jgi:arginyl-tRNA--protein-N-Asp/Glu arginylyltransferase